MNRRFDGYRKAPLLWEGLLEGLRMFVPSEYSTIGHPNIDADAPLRLGKLMEQFVLFELEQDEAVQILRSNVQVFQKRRTIGELDCLINQSGRPIHLEIVYKFYLYDPSISPELNRWIGPNRNDSLVLKLGKLKEKQLPLLYRPETAPLLNDLALEPTDFNQEVYFKAELFVPLNAKEKPYQFVNEDCIIGFYIRPEDLSHFTDHTFYIPTKLDWVVEPHLEVDWISSSTFQENISYLLAMRRAPLCWMKSAEGEVQKFFVVWWA